MFLPSPISGALADRYGRLPVIAAGGVALLLAGGLAAPTSGHHTAPVILALVLLGIGWNLGLVGGSALLTDSIPLADRARAQGQADFAMGMAGAVGSLASGPMLEQAASPCSGSRAPSWAPASCWSRSARACSRPHQREAG